MRKFSIGIVALAIALGIPTAASAHSGTVTCDSSGVVFHYNANFPITTTVTEKVVPGLGGNSTKTFVVPAHTAVNDTVAATGTVVASSTWVGGGTIPPTTLTCPQPPTPPLVPTCAPGDVSQGIVGGVLVCQHTVTVIQTVTNTITQYIDKWHTKIRFKTKIKIVKQRVLIPWCPLPPKKTPGIAG